MKKMVSYAIIGLLLFSTGCTNQKKEKNAIKEYYQKEGYHDVKVGDKKDGKYEVSVTDETGKVHEGKIKY